MINDLKNLVGTEEIDAKTVEELMEKGEYSENTAADWMAEAATQRYGDGELEKGKMEEYVSAAVEVGRNKACFEDIFNTLDREEVGKQPEINPNTPSRDRVRQVFQEESREFDDYDVVVAAGGSSASFAAEITGNQLGEDFALAVDRGKKSDIEEDNENLYTISYKLSEDNLVEVIGPDIEDKNVLMVTDYGTREHSRDTTTEAVIQASDNYDQIEVGAITANSDKIPIQENI